MIPFLIRWYRPLLGAALLLAVYLALRWYVASEVERARQADAAAVAKVDAIADDVAGQVAASQAATTEQENRDARQAASDSDDPLRAGLDRLRAGKTGSR